MSGIIVDLFSNGKVLPQLEEVCYLAFVSYASDFDKYMVSKLSYFIQLRHCLCKIVIMFVNFFPSNSKCMTQTN